jgi:hypothetical protein
MVILMPTVSVNLFYQSIVYGKGETKSGHSAGAGKRQTFGKNEKDILPGRAKEYGGIQSAARNGLEPLSG